MNRAEYHEHMLRYLASDSPRERDQIFGAIYPYLSRVVRSVCHTYRIPPQDHDDVISRVAMAVHRYNGMGHAESYTWVRARQYASHYHRDQIRATSTPVPAGTPGAIQIGAGSHHLPHAREIEIGHDPFPSTPAPDLTGIAYEDAVELVTAATAPGLHRTSALGALAAMYDDEDSLVGYNTEVLDFIRETLGI